MWDSLAKLYINWEYKWEKSISRPSISNVSQDMFIWSYYGWWITFDELRIYNRTLPQDEVQFLYKSNMKKTSENTWEFETLNTCLDASWTYDYTGTVVSYVNTQASTWRKLTTNIPRIAVEWTWYHFWTYMVTWSQRILTWTMWTLSVRDYLWKSWWRVYFTTSPYLVWKDKNQTIDTHNLKFKASDLIYDWLYDWYLNTHVTLWAWISSSEYNTAYWATWASNILEYIVRTWDETDFMCWDVWMYSDETEIELDIPAWQISDTYTWTLWITRQQN